MTEPITSTANPRVKALAALAGRRPRDDDNDLFLMEGAAPVARAAKRGFEVVELWHAGEVGPIGALERIATTPAVLAKITGRSNPQSVLGVLRRRWVELPDAVAGLWLALDRPRDPGNLGTILRTAAAVAANGVILIGEATDPFALECVRGSAGTLAEVPLARSTEPAFIAWAAVQAAESIPIVGTAGDATLDYRQAAAGANAVLLMGNESEGLTPTLRAACSTLVRIPMPGGIESLNLAVATGVMLYELARARI